MIFINTCLNIPENDSFPAAYIVDDYTEAESNAGFAFEQLSRRKKRREQINKKMTANQFRETYMTALNGITEVYGKNSRMTDFKIFSRG